MSGCQGRGAALTRKGHEGTFWGDENVLYHDCVGGYMTLHVFQNASNCTLNLGEFYYV